MKAGIIAAGLGERLRAAGILTPKPLLRLAGRTLLERTVDAVVAAGATEIALIVNAEYPEVARAVRTTRWPVPLHLTVKTTPSSMESFFALAPHLSDSSFLLTTVDAVMAPGALAGLARHGLSAGPSGTLAVTNYVDDEKPLWVRVDGEGAIVALGPEAARSGWVTSGAYFFFPEVYDLIDEARRRDLTALRAFLALILERGGRLFGFAAGDAIDVDRPEDIVVAERFLKDHD